MKRFVLIGLCCAALLGGCTSLASGVATIATSLSSSSPSQANTLAGAEQAATLLTQAADVYVNSGVKISRAQLQEILLLSDAVHTALGTLERANAAGQSLDYAAFNAALSAYQSYATNENIPH